MYNLFKVTMIMRIRGVVKTFFPGLYVRVGRNFVHAKTYRTGGDFFVEGLFSYDGRLCYLARYGCDTTFFLKVYEYVIYDVGAV